MMLRTAEDLSPRDFLVPYAVYDAHFDGLPYTITGDAGGAILTPLPWDDFFRRFANYSSRTISEGSQAELIIRGAVSGYRQYFVEER